MNKPSKPAILICGMGIVLAGCASKERTDFNTNRPNWLKADSKAVNKATEVASPKIQPRTHFAAGQLFEQQGEIRKAIIQYRKAIVAGNNYVAAYNRLGVLLGRLGRHTEAEQALLKAVELRPDWAFLRNNLGFEYILQERWSDAEAELRNAIRLKSDFVRAHNNLGMVLFKLGRSEESLSEFDEAVPKADAYYNLGLMFRGENRFREAANAFEHALSKAPNFEAAKIQLARIAPHLERASALELTADMADWETVAQVPETRHEEPPDAPTVTPQALTGDVNVAPESERIVLQHDTSATPADDAIIEKPNFALADDFLDCDSLDEEPCEDEFADAHEDDVVVTSSDISEALVADALSYETDRVLANRWLDEEFLDDEPCDEEELDVDFDSEPIENHADTIGDSIDTGDHANTSSQQLVIDWPLYRGELAVPWTALNPLIPPTELIVELNADIALANSGAEAYLDRGERYLFPDHPFTHRPAATTD